MNRRRPAKKQTRAKSAKRSRTAKKAPPRTTLDLDAEGTAYVGKLASAVADVSAAQDRWLADIDLASRRPDNMRDQAWRSRSEEAMRSLMAAANTLRIEAVPEALAVVDRTMGRAQDEAQMANDGYLAALDQMNTAAMLQAVQHVDRMGQFIQQAYALVRNTSQPAG